MQKCGPGLGIYAEGEGSTLQVQLSTICSNWTKTRKYITNHNL